MATNTERFGFTLPSGQDPASIIPLNLNTQNIEKYLGMTQDMLAPLYDATEGTYEVDDIVTHDSVLYKCITAVETPEAFDETKWVPTTATQEGGGASNVEANPTGTPTDTLSTIGIDGTIYGIEASGGSSSGSSEAEDINYDNTTSQLTADNVQDAIDEVVANADTASEDVLTLQNVQGYDAYDETQTYAVGDYAIYNNHVYECTTAVSTAEPFDSSKWTATSIEQIIDGVKGDVSQLNSSLTNSFKIIDTNPIDVTTNQMGYASITPPTTPTGYTLLATALYYWSNMTIPSAISIDAPGTYVLTSANNTIKALRIRYIYVKTSQVSS